MSKCDIFEVTLFGNFIQSGAVMDRELIETAEHHVQVAKRNAMDALAFTRAHGFSDDVTRRIEWGSKYIAEALRLIELLKTEPGNA